MILFCCCLMRVGQCICSSCFHPPKSLRHMSLFTLNVVISFPLFVAREMCESRKLFLLLSRVISSCETPYMSFQYYIYRISSIFGLSGALLDMPLLTSLTLLYSNRHSWGPCISCGSILSFAFWFSIYSRTRSVVAPLPTLPI